MGGFGSGLWSRTNKREYLDDLHCLDVRQWKREGLIRPFNRFKWQWSFEYDEAASVGVSINNDRVILNYQYLDAYGECKSRALSIRLTYTDCHLGGSRVWYVCPGCKGRAAKLYYHHSDFQCRSCCNLPYKCQSDDRTGRAINRFLKIEQKLEQYLAYEEGQCVIKKGAHLRTVERLFKQKGEADVVSDAYINKRLSLAEDLLRQSEYDAANHSK